MNKIKRKIAVIALVAMLMTLYTQGTLAYESVIGTATNVVTTGRISFAIHETTDKGTAFPEGGVWVEPGDVVSKRVSIENICTHPFYLRVKMNYGVDDEKLSASDCFSVNVDESMWQLVDGWYYYKGIVKPGQTTPYMFTEVEVLEGKVNWRYTGRTLTMTVVAQAVQSENNPVSGTDTFKALGWPQEEV